ncbi:hypothetical protein [Galbibacter orientalis]|uniref:hypothetical protein n=1 Tax=Galbibacter orientalis TaxID=453852 RepID=UPI0012F51092|nr:hypothetical protein [Galbibacter orientalis]
MVTTIYCILAVCTTFSKCTTGKLYEIVVTQNTLLSATASLGTYIQIHHTTDASKYFDAYMTAIDNQLACSEATLKNETFTEIETLNLEETKNYLQQVFESLSQKRNSEIDAGMLEINSELREQLKEVRIISEQLEWLHNLSKNLHTAINGYIERVENL